MEPESLPLLAGLVAAGVTFRVMLVHRPSHITGYKAIILASLGMLFVASGLIKTILFLSMTEIIALTLGGAFGGFVLGMGMALHSVTEGDTLKEGMTFCWASTAIFAAIGLIGGALFMA